MQIQGKKPYNEINITPLVDLTFVLLIIFILLTTAAVQGIKVELPKASSAVAIADSKTRVVSVSNDGQLYLDAVPVTMAELEAQLTGALAQDPKLPVILKGDREVQYDKVMSVLDLCSRIGVSTLGLASTKPTSS